MANKQIYLDYAAATPLDENVIRAMDPYLVDLFYNPSAAYQPAREVSSAIETARHGVANIVGARTSEIIFTAGASESINLAFKIDGHVVTSNIEHVAVIEAAKQHTNNYTMIDVGEGSRINPEAIRSAIKPSTTLVSVGLVNNETGTIQDIKAIASVIEDEKIKRQKANNHKPIYLHTDASQAVGILDIHVARLGVDLMTLNGAKIYGPKQTGILYVNSSVQLSPIVSGGGQENGLRSGTENVAGIIGFAKALEITENMRKKEANRLHDIRKQMLEILEESFSELVVIGDQKHQAPHILTVAWQDLDAERVLFMLESHNILVATGSACAANKDTRSHVLTSLGLPPIVIDGSLRFSFGRQSTLGEVARAAKMVVETVKQELSRGKTNEQ